jgi:hypothetical protein
VQVLLTLTPALYASVQRKRWLPAKQLQEARSAAGGESLLQIPGPAPLQGKTAPSPPLPGIPLASGDKWRCQRTTMPVFLSFSSPVEPLFPEKFPDALASHCRWVEHNVCSSLGWQGFVYALSFWCDGQEA